MLIHYPYAFNVAVDVYKLSPLTSVIRLDVLKTQITFSSGLYINYSIKFINS